MRVFFWLNCLNTPTFSIEPQLDADKRRFNSDERNYVKHEANLKNYSYLEMTDQSGRDFHPIKKYGNQGDWNEPK